MSALHGYDYAFLKLLELSPFEQRCGGWRFGTKKIGDVIIARLIASRRAEIVDGRLVAARRAVGC